MKAHAIDHTTPKAPKIKRAPNLVTRDSNTKKTKSTPSAIKIVGANGQISLGKAYAGKSVEISKPDENTIVIKTGQFIPDNERWLYEGDNMARLDAAIKWAKNTPRKDNFEELFAAFKKWSDEND